MWSDWLHFALPFEAFLSLSLDSTVFFFLFDCKVCAAIKWCHISTTFEVSFLRQAICSSGRKVSGRACAAVLTTSWWRKREREDDCNGVKEREREREDEMNRSQRERMRILHILKENHQLQSICVCFSCCNTHTHTHSIKNSTTKQILTVKCWLDSYTHS